MKTQKSLPTVNLVKNGIENGLKSAFEKVHLKAVLAIT